MPNTGVFTGGTGATYFARAGRASYEEITRQVRESMEDPVVRLILDAVDGYVLILNAERQILAVNQELLDALAQMYPGSAVGLRPGEAFNCVHFTEGPDGCGTSEHCRGCGAVLAILASKELDKPVSGECRLSAYRDGKLTAMDLRVRATPLQAVGHALTAFVLHDISAQKRRELLEKTFFHDVLNTIGGIEGWSTRLWTIDPQSAAREILSLVDVLKEEVSGQQTLLAAERGDLSVHLTECRSSEVLTQIKSIFENHPVRKGKILEMDSCAGEVRFPADRALLVRVAVNMVKNAFEAIAAGETVRVGFVRRKGGLALTVHNPGVIPMEARGHIFERSFSTKAKEGRGVGTYSMKLYGERYLGGKMEYTSTHGEGTRFSLLLPEAHAAAEASPPDAKAAKRVLLIDDMEPVLRLATLFLEQLGCRVVACNSGVEALKAFAAAPESFDLVITDLMLPGMTGAELAEQLHAMRPGTRVYACTGRDDSEVPEALCGVIRKPFTVGSFAAILDDRAMRA